MLPLLLSRHVVSSREHGPGAGLALCKGSSVLLDIYLRLLSHLRRVYVSSSVHEGTGAESTDGAEGERPDGLWRQRYGTLFPSTAPNCATSWGGREMGKKVLVPCRAHLDVLFMRIARGFLTCVRTFLWPLPVLFFSISGYCLLPIRGRRAKFQFLAKGLQGKNRSGVRGKAHGVEGRIPAKPSTKIPETECGMNAFPRLILGTFGRESSEPLPDTPVHPCVIDWTT